MENKTRQVGSLNMVFRSRNQRMSDNSMTKIVE